MTALSLHSKKRLYAIILGLAMGCADTSPQNTPAKGTVSKKKDTLISLSTNTEASDKFQIVDLPKIDPNSLFIRNLVAGKYSDKNTWGTLVSFRHPPDLDYVDWKVCPLEHTDRTCSDSTQYCSDGSGECQTNTAQQNTLLIPSLFVGKIQISVRACIDKTRSTSDELCGPWEDILYNSNITNKELASALQEKAAVLSELGGIAEQKFNQFKIYKKDLEACLVGAAQYEDEIRKRIKIIDQYINLPANLFSAAGNFDAEHGNIGGTLTHFTGVAFKNTIGKVAKATCESFDKPKLNMTCLQELEKQKSTLTEEQKTSHCQTEVDKGFLNVMCGIVGKAALQFFEGQNPASSLAVLSDAIMDLTNPERSVTRNCTAEEALKAALNAFDKEMGFKKERLESVKAKIKQLGG